MFEPLSGLPAGVIGFEAVGEVTPDDFKDVFVPAIDEASKAGKIRLVFVLGERYTGFTAGVVWEKAKMRAEHFGAWERCARADRGRQRRPRRSRFSDRSAACGVITTARSPGHSVS